MTSNSERREVARRLREIELAKLPDSDREMQAIHEAVGCWFSQPYFFQEVTDRLADLIEPSEPKVRCVAEVKVDGERLEQLVHDAAVELAGIDRDALLALADEMESFSAPRCGSCCIREFCERNDGEASCADAWVWEYARRIREALGEGES